MSLPRGGHVAKARTTVKAYGRPNGEGTMCKRGIVQIAAALLPLTLTGVGLSAPKYWLPASGDWDADGNWTPYGAPTAGDTACVDNGGTVTVSGMAQAAALTLGETDGGTFAQTGGTAALGGLHMGVETGSTGAATLQDGVLSVGGNEQIGLYGRGRFRQLGGSHHVSANLYLALVGGPSSVYELETGELVVEETEYVGFDGEALFTQTGGTHHVLDKLTIAYFSLTGGTYSMQGGVLAAKQLTHGGGNWAFDFTGGTLHAQNVGFDLANDGGVLAPGMSIGATDIQGGYRQNAGTLEIELASSPAAGQFDTLAATGLADLGGTLNVLALGGFRPMEGDTYPIITAAGGVSGDFATFTSNIVLGIPAGMSAFSGTSAGGTYRAVFNGYTGGDANGDHKVSIGDLAIMAGNWQDSGLDWSGADFNGDGVVSIGDLAVMAANWQWTLPEPPALPAPEPMSAFFLLGGAAAVLTRRRPRHRTSLGALSSEAAQCPPITSAHPRLERAAGSPGALRPGRVVHSRRGLERTPTFAKMERPVGAGG